MNERGIVDADAEGFTLVGFAWCARLVRFFF